MNKNGLFITFEGGEGVGKSTQIRLLAARLDSCGYETMLFRDPGGTDIGEKIRSILLDTANANLDPTSELLLYEAARAQLVAELIEPAITRGATILCDRFIDSTVAYQGVARALGVDLVKRANTIGSKGLVPDRTIVLLRDIAQSLSDATKLGADRLEAEGMDFHEQVHEAFITLAANEPDRVRIVRCQPAKETTAQLVFDELSDLFPLAAETPYEITPELLLRIKEEK